MTIAPKPAQLELPAIHQRQAVELVRCLCPECLRLDAQHKGEGHQMTFEQYRFSQITAPRFL